MQLNESWSLFSGKADVGDLRVVQGWSLPSSPSPRWVSSRQCVCGRASHEECCCCDLEGPVVAETAAHTPVCAHWRVGATQTDVWQIAPPRLCWISTAAPPQVRLSSRAPRNTLIGVGLIRAGKELCVSRLRSGANCPVLLRAACNLTSALQTGLRAWLNMR